MKHSSESKTPPEKVVKAALVTAIDKAVGFKRTKHGPEPERFKIEGYADKWQDAVKVAMRKKKLK